VYVMFMPAAVHKPGILVPFFLSMRARTEWAKLYLTGTQERQGRPESYENFPVILCRGGTEWLMPHLNGFWRS
jgi:hypothetical protein